MKLAADGTAAGEGPLSCLTLRLHFSTGLGAVLRRYLCWLGGGAALKARVGEQNSLVSSNVTYYMKDFDMNA